MKLSDAARLADALEIARDLTEPGEPNNEYVRGQAELICDLFGLPMDFRADVIKVITREMPVGDLDLFSRAS
jgi:hypothetical protein